MNWIKYRCFTLLFAGIIDQLIGDPQVSWHPICLIGRLCSQIEKHTRDKFPDTKKGMHRAGLLLVALVLAISTAVPLALTVAAYALHPAVGLAWESMLLAFAFAEKTLERESLAVYEALRTEGLSAGRARVARIVGRDTDELSEGGVCKATIETVAENTSDGVIAPMFYAMLGGAPLAYFYKAVNTMDSMVGYKNERYRWYGTPAARLDDFFNLIPARLSALLMLLVSPPLKKRWTKKEGIPKVSFSDTWHIFKRDRYAHASPNSAQTESVMAGVLGIRLAGDASYFGLLVKKPTIGDDRRPVQKEDILRAVSLMRYSACFGWMLAMAVCLGLWLLR